MEWYLILAVVGVGFVAGIINTLAAGGSLLTLPMLIIPLGIPSTNANAINRIAILLQNVIGVRRFQKKKVLDLKYDYKIGVPAVIGSLAGAFIASIVTAPVMDTVIGVVMLVMFLVVLLVFGGKEMPQVVRKIVRGMNDVQKATRNARDEIQKIMEDDDDDSELMG